MKSLFFLLASTLAAGLPLDTTTNTNNKLEKRVVSMAVHHRPLADNDRLAKRGYVNEPLQNQIYQYTANVSIGNPSQDIEVLLDTGSSDLWVYSDTAIGDRGYHKDQSSTYELVSNNFQIQYVSGKAKGEYVKDKVELEGATIDSQQFAVVDNVNTPGDNPIGIFGIGFSSGVVGDDYSNFPQSLVDNKLISRNAYSLYLDSANAASGQVLFGGVDLAKFYDHLTVLPVKADDSLTIDFSVEGVSEEGVLDCGTSLTYLPKSAVESIVKRFGATYDPNTMLYFVDQIPNDQGIQFQFGDKTINVPANEMVLDAQAFSINNPPKKYILALAENDQSSGINLLGDSFLRTAYLVFDLANKQVAIGQASYSSESNIQELDEGTSIPGV